MPFISELHYSNAFAASTGVAEFLEVTLLPGENPADYTVSFYDAVGQNAEVGVEINLTDPDVIVTTDPGNGRSYYVISADNFDILLTDPTGGQPGNFEAYALTDIGANPDQVLGFFDIGGGASNLTAVDGLAAGAQSTNIPVSVPPNTATFSVQFTGANPTTPIFEPLTPGGPAPCFVTGTKIATPSGKTSVEDLRAGDLVLGHDGQHLKLEHVLYTPVRTATARQTPKLKPIKIAAGALGGGLPAEDLWVSRQHRMLLHSAIAERVFGTPQVLVAANKLLTLPGITQPKHVPQFDYHHLIFKTHEVIFANGAPTESFLAGRETLTMSMFDKTTDERVDLSRIVSKHMAPARPIPTGKQLKKIILRHLINRKPVLDPALFALSRLPRRAV